MTSDPSVPTSGWHPKDTEKDIDILRAELDGCTEEIARLRELNRRRQLEIEDLVLEQIGRKERSGDPRFHAVLETIADLHDKKQADYGKAGDPFANVRASEDFGVDGWVGCMMRANDKMRRLQQAAVGQTLQNESIEDSLMDLAVYSIIGLVLFRETVGGPSCEEAPCLENGQSTPDS